MYKRQLKLRALGYHSPENFDVDDREQLKALVVWLENQKIRFYKIEDRTALSEKDGEEWMADFKKYLEDLACPFLSPLKLSSACDWLVAVAVKYEFDDKCKFSPQLQCKLGEVPEDYSRLSIDPSDPDLRKGTEILSSLLHIVPHPDVGVSLEAIRMLVEERLVNPDKEVTSQGKSEGKRMNISAKECGFKEVDPALAQAAKTLRLLHLGELRALQTDINKLIMSVQAITANPKTNHSLGKVGK